MNFVKLIFITALLVFSQVLPAQEESWYQVEIIVFDRISPDLDGEQWVSQDIPARTRLVELLPAKKSMSKKDPFSILPTAKNRLSGAQRVLRLSSNYRPLLHYSWQQPATERQDARFVHIQIADENPSTDTAEQVVVDRNAESNMLVDGAIRIRSGFYLHVDVDLYYLATLPQQNQSVKVSDDQLLIDPFDKISLQLKETRKIKLNEIHYFDHPLFGLIIQVSRLES